MLEILKLLLIEDSEDDARLIERELSRAGYDLAARCIQTGDEMRSALEDSDWDLIISDFRLPAFDGLAALAILNETQQSIPFILVSGIVGEETAVEAMKAGAQDYIMKSNLSRLVPAVQRELREAELRKNYGRAEIARQASEAKYQALVENLPAITYISRLTERSAPLFVSPQMETILGFTPTECIEDPTVWERQVFEGDRECVQHDVTEARRQARPFVAEYRMHHRDGHIVWIRDEAVIVRDKADNPLFLHGVMSDISAQKKAERALQQKSELLQAIIDTIPVMLVIYDAHGNPKMTNREFDTCLACTQGDPEAFLVNAGLVPVHALPGGIPERMEAPDLTWTDISFFDSDDSVCQETSWTSVRLSDGAAIRIGIDITDRKRAEAELYRQRESLRALTYELSMVEESERRRIATDIHDQVSQTLALCKIKLGTLQKAVELKQVPAQDTVSDLQAIIDRIIKETRTLSFELSPPVLYELGLGASLEWLADWFNDQYGIPVERDVDPGLKKTDETIGVLLFRAVRELFSNIGRHAGASHARLKAGRGKDTVDIILTDDGTGFDVNAVRKNAANKRSYGLFSISERLEHIGGRLVIESSAEHGTKVTLQAPNAAEESNGNPYHPRR